MSEEFIRHLKWHLPSAVHKHQPIVRLQYQSKKNMNRGIDHLNSKPAEAEPTILLVTAAIVTF